LDRRDRKFTGSLAPGSPSRPDTPSGQAAALNVRPLSRRFFLTNINPFGKREQYPGRPRRNRSASCGRAEGSPQNWWFNTKTQGNSNFFKVGTFARNLFTMISRSQNIWFSGQRFKKYLVPATRCRLDPSKSSRPDSSNDLPPGAMIECTSPKRALEQYMTMDKRVNIP